MKKLAIIGAGLAGKWALYFLGKNQKKLQELGLTVDIYDGEKTSPACSLRTTAIVSLHGARRGLSPLGDLICDSYQFTENLFDTMNFNGVTQGQHYYLMDPMSEKKDNFSFRFPHHQKGDELPSLIKLPSEMLFAKDKAYYVSADLFSESLLNKSRELFEFNYIERTVKEIHRNESSSELEFLDKSRQGYDYVIIATGAYTKSYSASFPAHDKIDRSQLRAGSYLEYRNVGFNNMPSFGVDFDKYYLIYREHDDTLIMGSTTNNFGARFAPEIIELKKIHDHFSSFLNESLEIPAFENMDLVSGLRHKGQKRLPFADKIDENIWAFFGLYKNGWTFAPYLGEKLVNQLLNEIS